MSEDLNITNLSVIIGLFVLAFVIRGIWSAFLIYTDSKRRNIDNKTKWLILGFFLQNIGFNIYASATQRPQTISSMSTPGIALGETPKNKKFILGFLFFIGLVLIIKFILPVSQHGFVGLLSSADGGEITLTGFIGLLLVIYASYGLRHPAKTNVMDKALWGMDNTPQGPVDTSLTKHKKIVFGLLVFIILLPFLFFLYVKFIL